jgi:hypothetical protein
MTQITRILADCVSVAMLDKGLATRERLLLENVSLALDASAEGMPVFKYLTMMERLADADEARMAKRRAAEAKSNQRRPIARRSSGRGVKSRTARRGAA